MNLYVIGVVGVTIPIVTWTSEVRARHVTLGHVHLRAVRAAWGRISGAAGSSSLSFCPSLRYSS